METTIVRSSHGSIIFDSATGVVQSEQLCGCSSCPVNISKFDVEEYKSHYGVGELPDEIDILDLGFWLKTGDYEEALQDWREEAKRLRAGEDPGEFYQVPIHTVEGLFDIDSDDNNQEVILVSDLTPEQKQFLQIPPHTEKEDSLHEVGMIAAVMSDHLCNKAYNALQVGYIETISLLSKWAVEFYRKYEEPGTDWNELLENPEKYGFSSKVMCWDDAVMEFADIKLAAHSS